MKRVVDDGLPRRAAMVVLDGGAHALSLELAREGHHGRRPAVRRRDRAREEIVGERDRVAHGLIEMAVRVDPARQHVAPGGVDLPSRGPEVPAERGDDPARDADVGGEDVGRGDHDGVPDDRVELCHGFSLPACLVE